MTLRFKILAFSALTISVFFLGAGLFVNNVDSNINIGIAAFVLMIFLIILLVVYHVDKGNNKKTLEKYNKENNFKGEDILDAVRVKHQDRFPILKKTKKVPFSFSKLSPFKKILIIIYILSFFCFAYFGFMNLVKQELNKPTEEEMYKKMNVSGDIMNYIKENK